MKFSEILTLFKQGKSTARSHMKNLIEMAAVDGNFDDVEYSLLKRIAKRNSISEAQLKTIRKNSDNIIFEVPKENKQRFDQLFDLVHMMVIDNEVHQEELKLCDLYAVKFGYKRDVINDLIKTIKSNIEHGNDHEDTYKRVNWMIGQG